MSTRPIPHPATRTGNSGWIVGTCLVLVLGVTTAVIAFQVTKPSVVDNYIDLQVYRDAARAWLDRDSVYPQSFTSSVLPFTYPPFALVLFFWLPYVSLTTAGTVVLATSLAALLAVSALSVRKAMGVGAGSPIDIIHLRWVVGTTVVYCFATVLEPVTHTLDFGQINLILCALVTIDALLVPPGKRGVLTGLALATKLVPGVFLVYFLVTRQRRAAVRLLAAAAAATLLAAVLRPAPSLSYWRSVVFENRTGPTISASNQNWLAVADRMLPAHHLAANAAVVAIDLVTLVLGVRAIGSCHRRGHAVSAPAVCGVIGLLVSPVSWSHHWVWIVPLLAGLVLERPCRGARPTAVLLSVVFLAGAQWHVPHFYGRELTWTWWQSLLGDGYSLAGFLAIGMIALLPRPNALFADQWRTFEPSGRRQGNHA